MTSRKRGAYGTRKGQSLFEGDNPWGFVLSSKEIKRRLARKNAKRATGI